MYRLAGLAAVLVGLALLGSSPAIAAPAAPVAPPGFERLVFVHYPKNAGVKPEGPNGKGGGTAACPDPSTCPDFKYGRVKWASTPVTYEVNFAGAGANYDTAVDASFGAWDSATTASLFSSGGSGPAHASSLDNTMDGISSVTWEDFTASYPKAIGVTFVWRSLATKNIVEVDTVLNNGPGFSWSYTAPTCDTSEYSCNPSASGSGNYDVRDILTHEVGHWLMLNDLYNSRDSQLTMYGYGATGELKKDSLGKGDCLGVTSIYGGTCP